MKKLNSCTYISVIHTKDQSIQDTMSDCYFNSTVIDEWSRQTYQARKNDKKNDKQYQDMMKPIRRSHICQVCNTYPGDSEYLFGLWQHGGYKCFDCL